MKTKTYLVNQSNGKMKEIAEPMVGSWCNVGMQLQVDGASKKVIITRVSYSERKVYVRNAGFMGWLKFHLFRQRYCVS